MYAYNYNLFLKNLIKIFYKVLNQSKWKDLNLIQIKIFYKVLNQLKLKDFKINNFQNCAVNVKKK